MLDVRDLLLLGASAKQDKGVLAVCKIAGVALWNIKDTYNGKTFHPQEEEIKTLSMLAQISKEFWSRQSGSLYRAAYRTLRDWREQQIREKQNEDQSNARRTH